MAATIQFERQVAYRRKRYDGELVWVPEINAEFASGGGRSRMGRALLDTGSPWCSIPKDVAVDHLRVDVAACSLQRIAQAGGGEVHLPYTFLQVKALGVEARCKVLLSEGGPYLVGRVPLFSLVDIAFSEESDGSSSRILVATK